MSAPQICLELFDDDPERSQATAIEENPDNTQRQTPAFPADWVGTATDGTVWPAAAYLHGRTWRPGRTLRIGFMSDVRRKVRERIREHAMAWLPYPNLQFEFTRPEHAEIRISTQPTGSWSYVGTDALRVPPQSTAGGGSR